MVPAYDEIPCEIPFVAGPNSENSRTKESQVLGAGIERFYLRDNFGSAPA
jgi:hypothetical protein